MAHFIVTFIRVVGPLLFGFVVGSLLSLAIFPTLPTHENDELNCIPRPENSHYSSKIPIRIRAPVNVHSKTSDQKRAVKVARPKFYATELDMRDKLLVGILTDGKLKNSRAIALNQTTAHHVSKLMFFTHGANTNEISDTPLNIANYAISNDPTLRLLHAFEYIGKHVITNYDWFFFAPDSLYIKGFKLFELASHISIGESVWLGTKMATNSKYCDFRMGFMASQDLMRLIVQNVVKCQEQLYSKSEISSDDVSTMVGRCIHRITGVKCTDVYQGKYYRSYYLKDGSMIDKILEENAERRDSNSAFNSAIAVAGLKYQVEFHKLHMHYCELELEQLSHLSIANQRQIQIMKSQNNETPSWPAGVPAMWKPNTRYETFKWDFFTDKMLFTDDMHENALPLSGQDIKDVNQVVKRAQKYLEGQSLVPGLVYKRFMSGYRLFDPSRGSDYVIDLIYTTADNKEEEVKRVHLLRPLTKVDIIPVPYVTEATRVTILLPVRRFEISAAQSFLAHYAKECLNTGENSRLIVVIMETDKDKTNVEGKANLHEDFLPLLRDIRALRHEYPISKKDLDTVKIRDLNEPIYLPPAMDAIIDRYGKDVLYLWVTPWTEVYPEFMNHVRMNTIKSTQVFLPIPFKQFNPALVYSASKIPGGPQSPAAVVNYDPQQGDVPIVVHKNTGHFDRNDFSISAFYGSDLHTRNRTNDYHVDLVHSFMDRPDLHIMRATDHMLKVRYVKEQCQVELPENDYARCLLSRREGLASKSQLATLVLKQQFMQN